MIRIGLMSDTHSYLDPKIFEYFSECDEIWHAGDIGSVEIMEELIQFRKTRFVFGNIDGGLIRKLTKENELFDLEGKKILMTHIAGKFESYTAGIRNLISLEKPGILVCGHSHLLKVAFDKKHQLLYLNPGACGKTGFHIVRTLLRFNLSNDGVKDMQVIELHPRN